MAMFEVKVNGVWTAIPTPSEWTCSWQDLSTEGTAGRSLDGTMHKDLVAVKMKNALVWWAVEDKVAKAIKDASKSSVFIEMRYPDPLDGGTVKTITVYTGDIVCTAQMAMGHYRWQITLSFIEQ